LYPCVSARTCPSIKKMSRRLKAQCVTVRSLLIHARKRSAQRINGQAKIQFCKRKDMRKFLVLDCVCVCNGEVTAIYRSRLGDDLETKKT